MSLSCRSLLSLLGAAVAALGLKSVPAVALDKTCRFLQSRETSVCLPEGIVGQMWSVLNASDTLLEVHDHLDELGSSLWWHIPPGEQWTFTRTEEGWWPGKIRSRDGEDTWTPLWGHRQGAKP